MVGHKPVGHVAYVLWLRPEERLMALLKGPLGRLLRWGLGRHKGEGVQVGWWGVRTYAGLPWRGK